MFKLYKVLVFTAVFAVNPTAWAENGKDCLLEGTVVHAEREGQATTQVNIHSVSRYDDQARCKVRRGQKMEFKLPRDTRIQAAPSGSEVKYRYRTDETGQNNAELISVGA